MELIPYDPSMDKGLTAFYNEVMAPVPHCYPVDSASLGAALVQPHERLEERMIQVAFAEGQVQGFVDYGVHLGRDEQKVGTICTLCYQRGHRQVGQLLLERAEGDIRHLNLGALRAFSQRYRYPFYGFAHTYLSNHLGHVEALFGYNGYAKVGGEVFLDGMEYAPLEPAGIDLPFELELEWVDGAGSRPDLKVLARQGDKKLGECFSVSCETFSKAKVLQDWHFCDWLGVEEEVQGQRLGHYLLARARLEMHKVGYRHASISTSWTNYRAFQFYSNYGYQVADWTYEWGKEL